MSDDALAPIGGDPAGGRGVSRAAHFGKRAGSAGSPCATPLGFTLKRQVSDVLSFDVHAVADVNCVDIGEPSTRRTVFPSVVGT